MSIQEASKWHDPEAVTSGSQDFEQTIANKAIDQWSKQAFVRARTILWTLAVYDILHCVDK